MLPPFPGGLVAWDVLPVCTIISKEGQQTASVQMYHTQNQWSTALLSQDIRFLISRCQLGATEAPRLGWNP